MDCTRLVHGLDSGGCLDDSGDYSIDSRLSKLLRQTGERWPVSVGR